MTIPVSDRRADQRRAEPRPATSAFIKSPVNAKRRYSHHRGLARKHSRHGRANETPRGIGSVAFIRGKYRPERDPAPRAQSSADNSKGR